MPRGRRTVERRRLAVLLAVAGGAAGVSLCVATAALGRSGSLATMPVPPEPSDLDEVEELDVDGGPGEPPPDGETEQELKVEDEVLRYSQEEVRGRFDYGVGVALGATRPWQTYSVAAFANLDSRRAVSVFAGAGKHDAAGVAGEKSYDLSLTARATGVAARYFVQRLDRVAVEPCLGYAAWEGRLDPHGSDDGGDDDGVEDDPADRLTQPFTASGAFVGLRATITWLWDDGFYLDWTVVGMRKSFVLQKDFARDAPAAERTVVRDLERPSFFGLANLEAGYLF